MGDRDTRVLGYVAVQPGTINVFCDGDSCIVAGSERQMREYIAALSADRDTPYRISKARYGHVLRALKLGGAYSFDRESFSRFCSLARADGLDIVDFTPNHQERRDGPAIPLMRVQWILKQ